MESGALHAPVRYSPDVEVVRPDEGKTIEGLNETFDTILKTVADDSGHAVRSVHAKAHGILEGVLRIDADLPPELAQGLFAAPFEHKVIMRMSTNAGDILAQPDIDGALVGGASLDAEEFAGICLAARPVKAKR